ncbi:unnamed protein product [Adineta ricciae]|uniref:UBC core domain-containing protein n=1 Tax=Adineta ricciae TaxID=249248 RepID=A0A815W2V8_ADIRI|nr:unnamed protein product [Adineta ricciae]
MNNNSIHVTLFEDLPVEILLKIFHLLSLDELVTKFLGLNTYINLVIQSLTHIKHTIINNDTNAIDLRHLFATQIDRLIITRSPSVDFTSLNNLRSLTIKYGTVKQLYDILPQHFPRLEILHINGLDDVSAANARERIISDLFKIIFSNRFPRLRICTATQIGILVSKPEWTKSPALLYLQLDSATAHVRDQIYSTCPNLRSFKSFLPPISAVSLSTFSPYAKRLHYDLMKIQQWKSENRFILDYCSTFYNGRPPSHFGDLPTITRLFDSTDNIFILGRILPNNTPYNSGSFLIKITVLSDYPFQSPVGCFLDPIYHPNVRANGRHCCNWIGPHFQWTPTFTLVNLVNSIIHIIENPDLQNHRDIDIANEYQNNYERFYDKALKCTLKYGRPRI